MEMVRIIQGQVDQNQQQAPNQQQADQNQQQQVIFI